MVEEDQGVPQLHPQWHAPSVGGQRGVGRQDGHAVSQGPRLAGGRRGERAAVRLLDDFRTSEVDRTIKLFNKKACKSLSDLPAAIDILDKELRKDEDASGHRMPDHTKIALLVRLFPEKDEKDLKHRFVHGQKSFEKVRAEIMAVAVNERLEITTRGVRDMEVDALADHKNQEAEDSYTAKEWFDWVQEEEQVDYMGKGKGKGKGKLADAGAMERQRRRQRWKRRWQRQRQR